MVVFKCHGPALANRYYVCWRNPFQCRSNLLLFRRAYRRCGFRFDTYAEFRFRQNFRWLFPQGQTATPPAMLQVFLCPQPLASFAGLRDPTARSGG